MLQSRNHNTTVYLLIEALSLCIKIINFVCFCAKKRTLVVWCECVIMMLVLLVFRVSECW